LNEAVYSILFIYFALFLSLQMVKDVNKSIAAFKVMLQNIGTGEHDTPEHREDIRKVRRKAIDFCRKAKTRMLPAVRKYDISIISYNVLPPRFHWCLDLTNAKFFYIMLHFPGPRSWK
jgi:hypothetical protein